MKSHKERLLQQAAEHFTKAKKARPDKITEQKLRERGGRLFSMAVKAKK
jgi:hypothetical protein